MPTTETPTPVALPLHEAAPCLKCQTIAGGYGRNQNRPARVKGMCLLCYDRVRYGYSGKRKSRALRPPPRPVPRLDHLGPLAWLIEAFDRRDFKTVLSSDGPDEMEDAA